MTADEFLREAATLLRHRVSDEVLIRPGPWVAEGFMVWADDRPVAESRGASWVEATYIAMMHPGVALALADWLDDEAAAFENRRPGLSAVSGLFGLVPEDTIKKPLAVAESILGRTWEP